MRGDFYKLFEKSDLVPKEWLGPHRAEEFYTSNPALFRHGDDLIMAVRVCGPDALRKVSVVRLTDDFEIVPGSLIPLSDHFRFHSAETLDRQSLTWFAEPRFFSVGSRLFIHFNNGGNPNNKIFLTELNPSSLLPMAPIREVTLAGGQKSIEKNWMFFEYAGKPYAIYAHSPLQILEMDLDSPDKIICHMIHSNEWDAFPYSSVFGEIRGGTTPIRQGSRMITMYHSAFPTPYFHPDGGNRRTYVAGILAFDIAPPFRPLAYTGQVTFQLLEEERKLPFLPALAPYTKDVFYPCGLVEHAEGIVISYGIDGEYAALRSIPIERIDEAFAKLGNEIVNKDANELFDRCYSHLMARVSQTSVGEDPFFHLFLEEVFPSEFYAALRSHMMACKRGQDVQDRHQDSQTFVNKRTNLYNTRHPVVDCVRRLFSDPDVKRAMLAKFYVHPTQELVNSLDIHEEFEYFYTVAGRFQNIHVDIPPKYLSFVFYIPEHPINEEEEQRNGTVLYDADLRPHYKARFKDNSVCVFSPHFSSYHGFHSTIDRDVLVMFYVSRDELNHWRSTPPEARSTAPFTGLLDAIEDKMRRHPLIEFGTDQASLRSERANCRVNAPQGRVMLETQKSDQARLEALKNYKPNWATRSALAASLIPDGASVLEAGAGVGHFHDLVEQRTRYLGTDLQPQHPAHLTCDLDTDPVPPGRFDYAVALGVFTYLHRPEEAARKLCEAAERIVVSYCCRRREVEPAAAAESRSARGWVNSYDLRHFSQLFESSGHEMESRRPLASDAFLEEYLFVFRRNRIGLPATAPQNWRQDAAVMPDPSRFRKARRNR